jgi:hypothetical protein
MKTQRTAKPEFWVIDTDTPGMSQGQFSASGPYPTQKAAEAAIIADTRNLWESACNCLQSAASPPWSAPQIIVQVVRKVEVQISASISLIPTP